MLFVRGFTRTQTSRKQTVLMTHRSNLYPNLDNTVEKGGPTLVSNIVNMSFLAYSNLLLICTIPMVAAQTPSATSSSLLSTDARAASSIIPSTSSFTYVGCYNETTGNPALGSVRALTGGNMVRFRRSCYLHYD